MAANGHPIGLERVLFTRSVVIAVPDHVPNGDAASGIAPENAIDINQMKDEPGKYQAVMRSKLNSGGDPSFPYIIDMECIAVLFANDSLSQEEAARGVLITAHSVLYGAIREAVAWITGRQPFGQLMLGLSVLPTKPPETVE
ncbi:hypothetical protein ACLIKD_08865 [Azonexus sp. IMCC34842]|uniref:hypothetical protein n=1 Tax=Azonexus sp. IMCC34842 TaxID=3420950 RepID=UPI003D12E950